MDPRNAAIEWTHKVAVAEYDFLILHTGDNAQVWPGGLEAAEQTV